MVTVECRECGGDGGVEVTVGRDRTWAACYRCLGTGLEGDARPPGAAFAEHARRAKPDCDWGGPGGPGDDLGFQDAA